MEHAMTDVFIVLGLITVPILIALIVAKARNEDTQGTGSESSSSRSERTHPSPVGVKVGIFFLEIVEATVAYILLKLSVHALGSSLPPLGSGVFLVFVVLWPFLISPFVRPGLQSIPLIGLLFGLVPRLQASPSAQPESTERYTCSVCGKDPGSNVVNGRRYCNDCLPESATELSDPAEGSRRESTVPKAQEPSRKLAPDAARKYTAAGYALVALGIAAHLMLLRHESVATYVGAARQSIATLCLFSGWLMQFLGSSFLAYGKGYNPLWGLLGWLSCIGSVIVIILPSKYKTRQTDTA
jgi:hypothetical protein